MRCGIGTKQVQKLYCLVYYYLTGEQKELQGGGGSYRSPWRIPGFNTGRNATGMQLPRANAIVPTPRRRWKIWKRKNIIGFTQKYVTPKCRCPTSAGRRLAVNVPGFRQPRRSRRRVASKTIGSPAGDIYTPVLRRGFGEMTARARWYVNKYQLGACVRRRSQCASTNATNWLRWRAGSIFRTVRTNYCVSNDERTESRKKKKNENYRRYDSRAIERGKLLLLCL